MNSDSLNITQQLLLELLGKDMTLVTLMVAYIFAACGLFLRWYWMYLKKGKGNPSTPDKFSLSFWLRDNAVPKLLGILSTIIVIFLSLRFPQQLAGDTFSYFYAVAIGIGLDYFIGLLKNLQPADKAAKENDTTLK